MKVKDAIRYIIDSLEGIYIPGEAESIAFIVIEHTGVSRKSIFTQGEQEISKENEDLIRHSVNELRKYKPIQYILGETEFYGLRFLVNPNVLIPRQETEELVQRIIRDNKLPNPRILDLGAGSGCISVSLAKNIPGAMVYGTDISTAALQTAAENARINEVDIYLIGDDILNSILNEDLKFDIIVSNPPYVTNSEKQFMHKNVLNFEPHSALFVSDDNPLEYYRAIIRIASGKLVCSGYLYVEINEIFGFEVARLFKTAGFSNILILQDIHDKDRIIKAQKNTL